MILTRFGDFLADPDAQLPGGYLDGNRFGVTADELEAALVALARAYASVAMKREIDLIRGAAQSCASLVGGADAERLRRLRFALAVGPKPSDVSPHPQAMLAVAQSIARDGDNSALDRIRAARQARIRLLVEEAIAAGRADTARAR